jgi:hypothetical protein
MLQSSVPYSRPDSNRGWRVRSPLVCPLAYESLWITVTTHVPGLGYEAIVPLLVRRPVYRLYRDTVPDEGAEPPASCASCRCSTVELIGLDAR